MNSLIPFKKVIAAATALLLTRLAVQLAPNAFGVVPPPDGGYPNFTTAEGTNALKNLTTGAGNSGVGWYSLFSDTNGSFNTAVGVGTLLFNNADENTAVGAATLLFNTASGNTAVGSRALLNNTTGGTIANIQGVDLGPNVAVGQQALENNTIASANTAVGYQALQSFTTGPVGGQVGLCTAVGFQALANSTGDGFANSGFGYKALMNNIDGSGNTGIGVQALLSNMTGGGNVAIGNNALSNVDSGDSNTAIGFNAGAAVTTANNVICIGDSVIGDNVNNRCYIGSIFGVTSPSGIGVFINSSGQLGTSTSSGRFKEEIKSMEQASEALYRLRPVTFRYKKEIDPEGRQQFGLVAEDVEKLTPDLVVRDHEGKPYSVRYDQVNAMLLNEFLKEHRKREEQERTIAHQHKDFEAAITQLKDEVRVLLSRLVEQDAKIQNLSIRTALEESTEEPAAENR